MHTKFSANNTTSPKFGSSSVALTKDENVPQTMNNEPAFASEETVGAVVHVKEFALNAGKNWSTGQSLIASNESNLTPLIVMLIPQTP